MYEAGRLRGDERSRIFMMIGHMKDFFKRFWRRLASEVFGDASIVILWREKITGSQDLLAGRWRAETWKSILGRSRLTNWIMEQSLICLVQREWGSGSQRYCISRRRVWVWLVPM